MRGRDGQRKAEKGSARKGRAAQGREGKRSVARSIAALMRWIPHGRERRGAYWAPPLLTVKEPTTAAPTLCCHQSGLQSRCPPASLPTPRGEPPAPGRGAQGTQGKGAPGRPEWVQAPASEQVWGCASLPLTAVCTPCAPGSPGALGVCPAEAPSRVRRGRKRLAASARQPKLSNPIKPTRSLTSMHGQLAYSKRGAPAPKKTKLAL